MEKQDNHWWEESGQRLRWARCWNHLDMQSLAQQSISSHRDASQLILAWSVGTVQDWISQEDDFWNSSVCLSPMPASFTLSALLPLLLPDLHLETCDFEDNVLKRSWLSHPKKEQWLSKKISRSSPMCKLLCWEWQAALSSTLGVLFFHWWDLIKQLVFIASSQRAKYYTIVHMNMISCILLKPYDTEAS